MVTVDTRRAALCLQLEPELRTFGIGLRLPGIADGARGGPWRPAPDLLDRCGVPGGH